MSLDAQELAQASIDAMWAGDRASRSMGMVIVSVAPGSATLAMTVREDMVNGHDIGHGGYIFSLADSAFACACNSQNFTAVAAGARVEFVAPVRLGDTLTASACAVSQGKRSGVYDVTVKNQNNRTVALFRGNSARIGGTLIDEITGETLNV